MPNNVMEIEWCDKHRWDNSDDGICPSCRIAELEDCIHGYGDAIDKKDDRIAALEGMVNDYAVSVCSDTLYLKAITDVLAQTQYDYPGLSGENPITLQSFVDRVIRVSDIIKITTEGKGDARK